jgi:hypothetical protein
VRRILQAAAAHRRGVARYGGAIFLGPIRVERPDELGALAERINGMAPT